MIQHTCPRCGKVLPAGKQCACGKARFKDYNSFRRNKKIRRFRQSAEWKAVREDIIERDEGLDQWLLHVTGEAVPGTSVHHIRPLAEDWKRRLSPGNLITLAELTHERIEYQYKHGDKEDVQRALLRIAAEQEAARHSGQREKDKGDRPGA